MTALVYHGHVYHYTCVVPPPAEQAAGQTRDPGAIA